MARRATKRTKRKIWTKQHVTALRKHSRRKSPVSQIAKALKRSAAAVRQKALKLGLPVGHRR